MAVCFLGDVLFPASKGLEQRFAMRAATPFDGGLRRRAKSTKGSTSNPNDNGADSSKMGPQSLTATGLKMTLSGVDPLDAESRMTWQDVTRDFIEADIWENQKKVDKVDVNVYFDRQDPPFVSRRVLQEDISNGSLQRILVRVLQEQDLDITFDVDMVVESKEPGNAFNYVSNAFDTDQKRAAYIQNLRATGDPAFGSASMNANLVSTAAPTTAGKTIGIIVGISIVVLIIVGCVAYVIHGNRANESITQEVTPATKNETDDESSYPEEDPVPVPQPVAPRPTAPPRSEARRGDDIPRTILVDDASTYFDGNVSVAWSMDTENQATQISSLT